MTTKTDHERHVSHPHRANKHHHPKKHHPRPKHHPKPSSGAAKPAPANPAPRPSPQPAAAFTPAAPKPASAAPAAWTSGSVRIYPTMATAVVAARRSASAPLQWNPVEHLLSRFTFGPTVSSRAAVVAAGYDGWFDGQLQNAANHSGYRGNADVAASFPQLNLSPYDARQWLAAQGNQYGWQIMDQLTRATLGLQAWSDAQVYESLVDFFSNHLNIANHNGDMWVTRHTHDRDVVRKYAFGTFTDMLLASSKNPAMLQYLNLAQSTKSAINENYGRELLELHTVGRTYSESDVKNAAKLLTGRTLDRAFNYVYQPSIHGTGAVTVYGFTHDNATAEGGEAAGDELIRYLASHRATAMNLARKMCVRFVSDSPSADLVNAVAKAYLDNRTAILPMVTTILRSTEFWESRGRKVRRPAENVIATIRLLDLRPANIEKATNTLHWMTHQMGHTPLDWPAPNGYPDVAAAWRSSGTLLNIWRMHLGMAGGWWDGLTKPALKTFYPSAKTSGAAIHTLACTLTSTGWSASAEAALQRFLDEPAATTLEKSRMRWLEYPLVALILDSPQHALR